MPQASDEQRARWMEPDGSIGEQRPVKFLQDKGYVLKANYHWKPPSRLYLPTAEEYDAISYMINEWDYGGIQRE